MIRSWTAALIRWSRSASGGSLRFVFAGIAAASERDGAGLAAATRSARVGAGAGAGARAATGRGAGAATGRGAGAAGGRCTEGVGRDAGPVRAGRGAGGGTRQLWPAASYTGGAAGCWGAYLGGC